MTVPGQPHDALFRALLDSPQRAGALLRDHLPSEVAALLAPEPPQLVDGTFIDEELRASRSDRLFAVTLTDGRAALLYTLLEHKSAPDPETPLQILGYMLAIWRRHLAETGCPPTRLPPIIPLVFYHGDRPWTVPLSVPECVDAGPALRPHVDGLRYVLRDLGPIPYEELSRERAVRAVLGALKYAFVKGITRDIVERLVADLPDRDALEIQVVRYILGVHDISVANVRAAVERAKPNRRDEIMPPAAQELIQQGRAEGLTEGKADMLLRLMRRRFGTVPPDVEARVRGAHVDALDDWSERILDAPTLDAVFDTDRTH